MRPVEKQVLLCYNRVDGPLPRLTLDVRDAPVGVPVLTDRTNQNPKKIVKAYAWTLFGIVVVTLLSKLLQPVFDIVDTALLFLLPVLISAALWGRGPSLFASFVGVFAFDFFFIPPFLSITVHDARYLFSFAVFLLVAFVTGTLANRLRDQAERSKQRERRTAALYELASRIAAETDLHRVLQTAAKTAAEAMETAVTILMLDPGSNLLTEIASIPALSVPLDDKEQAVARWVLEHGERAGRSTDTLSSAAHLFIPILVGEKRLGVLALRPDTEGWTLSAGRQQLLEAFANLMAVAITRIQLSQEAERVKWLAESEKLHTALLNSVSHDLRTPLASILGAVTGLLSEGDVYGPEARTALLRTVREEAQRMNRFVGNLLDMARLESGILTLKKEWIDMQDMVGVVLREMSDTLEGHPVQLDVMSGLPLVQADLALVERVLTNFLENAVKYSPDAADILVSVRRAEHALRVGVGDRAPVIAEGDRERVFDKFYRLHSTKHVSGTGLGLSICRGIIEAHGGAIWVEPREGGGNMFLFSLPFGTPSPERLPEESR